MYVCVYVWMDGWSDVYIYIYVCMYMYIYICICICMYTCMHGRPSFGCGCPPLRRAPAARATATRRRCQRGSPRRHPATPRGSPARHRHPVRLSPACPLPSLPPSSPHSPQYCRPCLWTTPLMLLRTRQCILYVQLPFKWLQVLYSIACP